MSKLGDELIVSDHYCNSARTTEMQVLDQMAYQKKKKIFWGCGRKNQILSSVRKRSTFKDFFGKNSTNMLVWVSMCFSGY